jgi:hypothetical protein
MPDPPRGGGSSVGSAVPSKCRVQLLKKEKHPPTEQTPHRGSSGRAVQAVFRTVRAARLNIKRRAVPRSTRTPSRQPPGRCSFLPITPASWETPSVECRDPKGAPSVDWLALPRGTHTPDYLAPLPPFLVCWRFCCGGLLCPPCCTQASRQRRCSLGRPHSLVRTSEPEFLARIAARAARSILPLPPAAPPCEHEGPP